MKKLIIFIFLLCAGRVWAEWIPSGFNDWQDTEDSLHKRTVIGAPPYFYQTDTSWEDIDNNLVNSGDTLLQVLKSVLKTEVTPDGKSKVTITWKGNEYTVTQKLLGIGWLNIETLAQHWIDSTMNWGNISYDSNIVTWRNVSPQVDFRVRKTNGQVAHGIFYKPLFLDSAVTLYNQRPDSADLALGNVVVYTLSANIENSDSIGRMNRRKLKRLGKWTFELGRQRVFFPGSDTIYVPVFQQWMQIGGKYVCIEYVMGSHIKQIHETYPNATIWHNASVTLSGADDTDDATCYIWESDYNYGGTATELTVVDNRGWAVCMKFDLSGVSGNVDSVRLECYVGIGQESDVYFYVAPISVDWIEGVEEGAVVTEGNPGMTWDDRKDYHVNDGIPDTAWTTGGGDFDSCSADWCDTSEVITGEPWFADMFIYSGDGDGLCEMVQDAIDGNNYGWTYGASIASAGIFPSEDPTASNRPELYVEYTAGAPAAVKFLPIRK